MLNFFVRFTPSPPRILVYIFSRIFSTIFKNKSYYVTYRNACGQHFFQSCISGYIIKNITKIEYAH